MKHYLVVNPVSGNGKSLKKATIIHKLLDKYGISSDIIISKYKGNIIEVTKKLSEKEKCRFYSIGGDGTLNEIVTGIIGTESEILIIPSGTGNDFVRVVSDYMSLSKIIKCSLKNDVRKVDVIKTSTGKYSINILNSGFDATVAYNLNKFRKVPFVSGSFKYNLAIIYTIFRGKNYNFKIRVDSRVYKGRYTLVAFANGKYYGGGISPVPNVDLQDGKVNICIIDSTNIFDKIRLLPKYKAGRHMNLKQVTMEEGKNISIVSNKKFEISLDGEIETVKCFKMEVLEKKVNIVFTKK